MALGQNPDWYNQAMAQAAQQAQLTQHQIAQMQNTPLGVGVAGYPDVYNPEPIDRKAKRLLLDRLQGLVNKFEEVYPDFLWAHPAGNTVYIFFLRGTKAGYIEDDIALFPSDKLVTQIRLLWDV